MAIIKARQKLVPLKKLKKEAWRLTSIYGRSKDADWRGYVSCYTCGVSKHWRQMDCGHYIHGHLDYDMRNLKPQCRNCNNKLWGGGRLDRYAEHLIKDYGVDWLTKLRKDAQTKGNNYSRHELDAIIRRLKGLKLE